MKKFLLLAVFLSMAALAQAQEENIKFPVAELGNCQSQEDCKNYCDQPANLSACLSFAEKNNLMSEEELAEAKKFSAAGGVGPGGCTSKDSCEQYCDNINNINECVQFAEKNDLLPPDELEEAKRVQAAVNRGIKPPCNSKDECDTFCESPENMKACITFAEAAGFLTGQELADAKKMLSALDKGVKPLPCRGKEECDSYCGDDTHIEECIAFAEAAGFMSPEEAEMAKKTGGKGPGGCRGKEECDAYCRDNQEACFEFAKENGLISEEELQMMEEGNKRFAEGLDNAPPEVRKCLEEKFGDLQNLKPSQEAGEKMKECFEQFGGPGQFENSAENGGMRPEGMGPEGEQRGFERRTGPGGCQGPAECEKYCRENEEECRNFRSPEAERFMERENFGERPERMMPEDGRTYPPMGEEYQYRGEMPPEGGFPPPGMGEEYREQYQYQEQMPPEGFEPDSFRESESPSPSYEGGNEPGGSEPEIPPSSLNTPVGFFLSILANIFFVR